MSGQTSILQYQTDISTQEAPPPLPARAYRAEIIGASVRPAQSSGIPYLNIQFRIPDTEYPADYTGGDPEGTIIYYNRLSTEDKPTPRYRMRQFMERIGGPIGRTIDCNALIGLWANIEITHQEYEGEQRANIARILAP